MKTAAYLTTAILLLTAISCKTDEVLYHNNITMGNAVDGTYITDQGNIFNVVENPCKGDIMAEERSLTVCDVLGRSGNGSENEYDVRLNQVTRVLAKDIVTLGTEPSAELEIEDPVKIESIWASGGYINMYILFPVKLTGSNTHIINLVQTESKEEGTYSFILRHNAQGDTITDVTSTGFGLGGGYVSFPINRIMTEDEATIQIRWKWYSSTSVGYGPGTEEFEFKDVYRKGGYEHIPPTPKEMAKANIR